MSKVARWRESLRAGRAEFAAADVRSQGSDTEPVVVCSQGGVEARHAELDLPASTHVACEPSRCTGALGDRSAFCGPGEDAWQRGAEHCTGQNG
jgi:hypothetical protein